MIPLLPQIKVQWTMANYASYWGQIGNWHPRNWWVDDEGYWPQTSRPNHLGLTASVFLHGIELQFAAYNSGEGRLHQSSKEKPKETALSLFPLFLMKLKFELPALRFRNIQHPAQVSSSLPAIPHVLKRSMLASGG